MQKFKVGILGATGAVGQRFIQLLEGHPWFEVAEVIASPRSAGRPYGETVNWILDGSPPQSVRNLIIKGLTDSFESQLIFSALPKEAAKDRELELAHIGHIICTNASSHRMVADVPLLLPEVNAQHIDLISIQRQQRGWSGAIIANSNCTTMPVVMALKPLQRFGIRKVHMVSEQAISGAGHPGVASLDIMDNVIPYVSGDEHKMETETQKMLGNFNGQEIEFADLVAGATCTRVPVIDGHLVNMSIELDDKPLLDDIIVAWTSFQGDDPIPNLPSAPRQPVIYLNQIDRPQIRRDRNAGKGMSTSIGRLRECPILDYKFAALTHNTIRGAAGCSILNAELLAMRGYFDNFTPNIEELEQAVDRV